MVLKGAGTVVAAEQAELGIIDTGNAGMASGGMGMCFPVLLAHCSDRSLPRMMQHVRDVLRTERRRMCWRRVLVRAACWRQIFTTLQRIVNPDVIDVYHDESSNSTT